MTSLPVRVGSIGCAGIATLGLALNAGTLVAQEADADAAALNGVVGYDVVEYDVVEYMGLSDKRDPWNVAETVRLRGEIRQFDGDKLTMLETDGAPRTLLSQQVVRVEPRWRNATAAATHQLFLDRKYVDVVRTVPETLKSDLVQWQQRLLIAEMVQAFDALGKRRAAGETFLSLANSNPPTLLFADMPLCWAVAEPDAALSQAARGWLAAADDAAQLLGASWLLYGDQSVEAKRTLGRLQSSTNSAVAQLAVAQSWRLVPPPQIMTHLNQWIEFRDKLLPALQLGPTELIADRLMRVGQTDLAIGQWLRIASLQADHAERAATALKLAEAQLKKLGREAEAQRLESWIRELAPAGP